MKKYLLVVIVLVTAGCSSIKPRPTTLAEIPHTRDRFANLWIEANRDESEFRATITTVQQYLATKPKLEGCFVRLPYRLSSYVGYLEMHGFAPYRLNKQETVWVFRNGRDIPDQSNTIADARVALFNRNQKLLLVRDRGAEVWTLPGGGIAAEELIKTAAAREVAEEVGVKIGEDNLQLVALTNLIFGISDQPTNIVQHFYVHTAPIDQTIVLEQSEIDDYAWVELKDLTTEFRLKGKPVNKKIVELGKQFSSATSKYSSMAYPHIPMNVETFKW